MIKYFRYVRYRFHIVMYLQQCLCLDTQENLLRCKDFFSVADADPAGSGLGKKSRSGSGINISDHISESSETIVWVKILKFFDANPGIFLTLDPGWVPDPHNTGFFVLPSILYTVR